MREKDCTACFINQLWTLNCTVLQCLGIWHGGKQADKSSTRNTPFLCLETPGGSIENKGWALNGCSYRASSGSTSSPEVQHSALQTLFCAKVRMDIDSCPHRSREGDGSGHLAAQILMDCSLDSSHSMLSCFFLCWTSLYAACDVITEVYVRKMVLNLRTKHFV